MPSSQNPGESGEAGFQKPRLVKKAVNRKLIGASGVGAKISGLKRKAAQQQRLGGHWTKVNGKDVFVTSGMPAKGAAPPDAKAVLARVMDRYKKKQLGMYSTKRRSR